MAVVNSFAKFFAANYPLESDVLNTAPTYGDAINVLDGTYDPGGGGTIPSASDVRLGVAVGAGTGTANIPVANEVLAGVPVDHTVGNVTLPGVGDVRLSVQFGSAFSRTGAVRVPPAEKVEAGYEYDDSDTITGTLDNGTVPSAADVRFGVAVGQATGLAYIPTASQVLAGVNVDQTTGNVVLPSINDVRLSTAFGSLSSLVGNITIPIEGDVRAGTTYGTSLSRTGQLDVTGDPPVYPAESDVRLGVNFGTQSQPALYSGNVRVPPVENVLADYAYDTLDSLTGELQPGCYPDAAEVKSGVVYGCQSEYIGTYICGTTDPGDTEWIG